MKNLTQGLKALTTESELNEVKIIGKAPVKLQYLKKSREMGLRLWNVLTPVNGYVTGPNAGFPTFSLQTLKEKELI